MSKEKEVKIFKLSSGEELIGHVEEPDDGDFTKWKVSNARMLGMDPQSGRPAMMPFMMLNPERPVIISISNITAVSVSVPTEVEKKFLEDTTGIALS